MDIKALVSKMTLEEKAGLCSGLDFWHTKPVERLGIPSVMMSDGPHGLRKQAQTADHLGINDSIKAVCMPTACAAAASFDRELLRRQGEALGDECQHEELAILLGPAVNIKRSPLCGRNFEYFSEDPYLAGEMAAANIHGIQSKNVGTSIKHFAANSQEKRRMTSSSEVDERTLREIYLPAFEKAVKQEQPWSVMCAYNKINGVYSSENEWLLTKLLRDEWGFENFVVSDWGAVSGRPEGVKAGLDLEMPSSGGKNDKLIVDAVRSGRLDEKYVDIACERILRVVYRYLDNAKPDTPWDKEAHHELAAQLAAECIVLLKNEDNILPLSRDDKIAFIGEFADKPRFQGGGSSHINCFKVTGALEAAKGMNVVYAQGYSADDDCSTDEQIADAVAAAKGAKVAVVFAGLPDAYESEGYDRRHMAMPECQNRLIEAVAAANPNTVVVLHNGSPVEMPWIDKVKAVVESYLAGQAVGLAQVRVLYGDVNPSGHLAETFPLKLEDNPSYLTFGGEKDTVVYNEGVFVGYRYYDKKKMDVLFPFGHGLSYTTFSYEDLRLSGSDISDNDTLTATVTVKNTGKRAGKAVVQLYVGDTDSTVFRPVRELKGFEKISLDAGETKDVSFTLDKRAFAYWSTQLHDWHVESGEFRIEIGDSSRSIHQTAVVTVHSSTVLPITVTKDTALGDVLTHPTTAQKAKKMLSSFVPFGMDGSSDAASEAMNDEMTKSVFFEGPLRLGVSFGGEMTFEQLEDMIDELNGDK